MGGMVEENELVRRKAKALQTRRLPSPARVAKKRAGVVKKHNKSKYVVGKPARIQVLAFYARMLALIVMSMFIVLILMSLFPLLAPFHRRKWRLLVDQFQSLWINGLLWLIPSSELLLSGDLPDHSLRPKVLICNHMSDSDFLFLWALARITNYGKNDMTGSVKIMLKEQVRSIPVAGMGCALFEFIFLKRDWDVDRKRIEKSLIQFCKDETPLWILLFPEGSTINTRCMEKSHRFAIDTNRPQLTNTLLPRVRGLEHVLSILEKHSQYTPEVYDLTMTFDSYSGEIPTWQMGYGRNKDVLIPNFQKVMYGTASRRCYIDCRKFTYKQIQQEHPQGLESWVDQRWVRKDRLLKSFAEKQTYHHDEEPITDTITVPLTGSIFGSLAAIAFYFAMGYGLIFTYIKYSTSADGFF